MGAMSGAKVAMYLAGVTMCPWNDEIWQKVPAFACTTLNKNTFHNAVSLSLCAFTISCTTQIQGRG